MRIDLHEDDACFDARFRDAVHIKGEDGRSIEYRWDGTRLGVRQEGEETYSYTDLIGQTGATGATGERGEKGEKGDKGDRGEPGGVTDINGRSGSVTLSKTDVGLGAVDNTPDLEKPISASTQAAFDAIDDLIPSTATTVNPLATEHFVREAAAGATGHYSVSVTDNPAFASDDAFITVTGSFTDIKGRTVPVTSLDVGDDVYVTDLSAKDRWVSDVTGNVATLGILETAKPPVQDVRVGGTSEVSEGIVAFEKTTMRVTFDDNAVATYDVICKGATV
ncbi:MAG: collagen-like protein [Ruminococcus sp.]|nr:collagen-like protein [Candidatus Apopatosoma intestinale]